MSWLEGRCQPHALIRSRQGNRPDQPPCGSAPTTFCCLSALAQLAFHAHFTVRQTGGTSRAEKRARAAAGSMFMWSLLPGTRNTTYGALILCADCFILLRWQACQPQDSGPRISVTRKGDACLSRARRSYISPHVHVQLEPCGSNGESARCVMYAPHAAYEPSRARDRCAGLEPVSGWLSRQVMGSRITRFV